MTKEKEKTNVTGLENAKDRKEAEYDLVKSLLEAAEYKTSENNIVEAEIKRNGKFMFSVHLHPISETDVRLARKKSTRFMPNPNGKRFPQIEKERDESEFKSWLIYLATTEEDQQKIWGNRTLMDAQGLMRPVESIDVLLTAGEKNRMVDVVTNISGFDDEEESMTEEEFRTESD